MFRLKTGDKIFSDRYRVGDCFATHFDHEWNLQSLVTCFQHLITDDRHFIVHQCDRGFRSGHIEIEGIRCGERDRDGFMPFIRDGG